MKIGVNTWVWTSPLTNEALQQLVPHVAKEGFDWIELPLEDPDGFDAALAAQLITDHGLGVSTTTAMGPDRDLIHPDSVIRESGLAYIRRAIEVTQALSATNLVGPTYAAVGRTWQQTTDERARDLDVLVANLSELAAYAGDRGVVLGIEPLNRFETSFINLADQAIEVIDRVDHPSCRIMLDTFHMNIEEVSPAEAIRRTGKARLCHLHASESNRGTPGQGTVPWEAIAQALRDIAYDGPVVIESFTAQVKTIARAAAIWRPLADSQDALAAGGLAFLRQLLA
jgi:D-psicose/D-tagatose/L-ribulose 3-epimerase